MSVRREKLKLAGRDEINEKARDGRCACVCNLLGWWFCC